MTVDKATEERLAAVLTRPLKLEQLQEALAHSRTPNAGVAGADEPARASAVAATQGAAAPGVSQAVGKSRTTVTNLIRLLDLNAEVKALVENGDLEMGHARALLALEGGTQTEAASQVAAKGLSVRETEALVRRLNQPQQPARAEAHDDDDPDVRRLLADLTDRLGAKVALQQGTGGKGRLVISYNTLEELEGILDHIR